jgi:Tfp pilus assembly PilM family ATPase/Tfp pilus assembly protein PilN
VKVATRTTLGIDISHDRISLALVRRSKRGLELLKSASGPVPDGAMENGRIGNPAILAKEIRELASHNRMRTRLRRAAVSLVARPVVMQIMNMPRQVSTSVRQFVHQEVKHYVALSGKEIALDFCGVSSAGRRGSPAGAGTHRLFAVATDADMVARTLKACSLAGANVEAIEPPLLAYTRAFYTNKIAQKFDCNVLIAILQAGALHLCVFEKQTLDFVRTRDVTKEQALPDRICRWLAQELNAVLKSYDISEVQERPKNWEVTVVADRALLPDGADKSLRNQIPAAELYVRSPEDAYQDTPIGQISTAGEAGPSAVAIGLAMKLLTAGESDLRINLLPPETAEVRSFKKHVLITVGIIVAVVLLMALAVSGLNRAVQKVNENIELKKTTHSLNQLSGLIKEQKLLDKQIKLLSDRPGRLHELLGSSRHIDWPQLLNEIRNRTPKSLRITELSSEGDLKVCLKGIAASYEAVHLFVDTLNESELVNTASLIETEKEEEEDGLVSYEIDCALTVGDEES